MKRSSGSSSSIFSRFFDFAKASSRPKRAHSGEFSSSTEDGFKPKMVNFSDSDDVLLNSERRAEFYRLETALDDADWELKNLTTNDRQTEEGEYHVTNHPQPNAINKRNSEVSFVELPYCDVIDEILKEYDFNDLSKSSTTSSRLLATGNTSNGNELILDVEGQSTRIPVIFSNNTTVEELYDAIHHEIPFKSWAFFDVCVGLSVERPLRFGETLNEAMANWSNSQSNQITVRPYHKLETLEINNRYARSLKTQGYVKIEGKWKKRYLFLSGMSITMSKNSNGKDGQFFASLLLNDAFSLVDNEITRGSRNHIIVLRPIPCKLSTFKNSSSGAINKYLAFDRPQDYEDWLCTIQAIKSNRDGISVPNEN